LLSDFLQAIKQAAVEAVDATQPTAVFIGTVSAASPLSVRISQRLVLGAGHLLRLEGAGSLARGDIVVLIRFDRGQKYLILGRLYD